MLSEESYTGATLPGNAGSATVTVHGTGDGRASLIAFRHSAELALVASQSMLALAHASSQFWPQSASTHSLLCAFAEHADATVSGGGGLGGGGGAGLQNLTLVCEVAGSVQRALPEGLVQASNCEL